MRRPVHIVIGEGLPVEKYQGDFKSKEGKLAIEEVYSQYLAALQALFEKHKHVWKTSNEKVLNIL